MHLYTHVYTHMHIHTHIHVHIHTLSQHTTHARTHAHKHTPTHIQINTRVHIHICTQNPHPHTVLPHNPMEHNVQQLQSSTASIIGLHRLQLDDRKNVNDSPVRVVGHTSMRASMVCLSCVRASMLSHYPSLSPPVPISLSCYISCLFSLSLSLSLSRPLYM